MRLSLEAKPREAMTKGQVKRLRREGYALISVSEAGKESQHLVADAKAVHELLHRGGPAALIELKTGKGAPRLMMARQVQRDPVSHKILNVGMMVISARKPITAPVSVRLHGEPQPVKEGIANLDQENQTVEVKALPDKIPASIDLDVSGLELHGKVYVSDLPVTDDYEIVTAPETIIAVVHTVRAAVTEEGTADEAVTPDEEQQAKVEAGEEEAAS